MNKELKIKSRKVDKNTQKNFKDILNKNFPSAICQYCNKVTNIQSSNDFRRLVARNRTLSEINKTLNRNWHKWMNIKNSQIEVMHGMIAGILELIPEEQKKKAKGFTQEMRDEIKHAEKGLKKEEKK